MSFFNKLCDECVPPVKMVQQFTTLYITRHHIPGCHGPYFVVHTPSFWCTFASSLVVVCHFAHNLHCLIWIMSNFRLSCQFPHIPMEEGFGCSLLLIAQYIMNSYHNYVSLHNNSCWWACEIVLKHKFTLHFVI